MRLPGASQADRGPAFHACSYPCTWFIPVAPSWLLVYLKSKKVPASLMPPDVSGPQLAAALKNPTSSPAPPVGSDSVGGMKLSY